MLSNFDWYSTSLLYSFAIWGFMTPVLPARKTGRLFRFIYACFHYFCSPNS